MPACHADALRLHVFQFQLNPLEFGHQFVARYRSGQHPAHRHALGLVGLGHPRRGDPVPPGNDELGRELLAIMSQWDLDTSRVNIHDLLPTGTVEVALEASIPSYIIRDGVAWDEISWDANTSVMPAAEPSAIF